MKLQCQNLTLPVTNYDFVTGDGVIYRHHGKLLPNTIRGVICGPSNCGKTNVLLAILEHENGLRYENVYIYSKSLDQPKYDFLKTVIVGDEELELEPLEGLQYFEFSEHEQVISPEKVLSYSIMIFDDIALEKQDSVKEFYTRGRHKHVDCFYLCQSYSGVPKQNVRDNVNFLIIFSQDELNLKHIYNNHVNTDMKFNEFKDVCHECWKNKHGFLVIDKDSDINNGRYRKGFHDYFIDK